MAQVHMQADGSQAGAFPVASEGDYYVVVREKRDGTTKDSGRQKVDLIFEIQDQQGRKLGSVWHTLTFIPAGASGHGMWLHANHALGLPYDGELNYDTDDYLGASCEAHVVIDTWEGKQRNKISEFYVAKAPGNKAPKPPAARTLQEKVPF